MKKLIYFIFLLSLFSCKESDDEFSGVVNDINEDFFECTVDFVQFLDEENVVVRFETTLGKQTNYFYGRYNYTKDGNNYRIGDNLVLINNFQNISATKAEFRFIYGESLGFFCAQIFEELPVHIHQNFDAEAELEILPTDRTVGKWKIKKKSNFSFER